jgi:hypothetical protein
LAAVIESSALKICSIFDTVCRIKRILYKKKLINHGVEWVVASKIYRLTGMVLS